MIERAKDLALRLLTEFDNDETRLDDAFSLAFGRPPTAVEQELALEFIHAPTLQTPRLGLSRWEQYVQVLLSSNEFCTSSDRSAVQSVVTQIKHCCNLRVLIS